MCGILGGVRSNPISNKMIECGLESLHHRGPDERGYFSRQGVWGASTRLKIIDLDKGKQPIFNEDKSIAVVYNGEIYNHLQHRRKLLDKGHILKSKTDTEIIPHLYEEHGEDFVNQLNGIFAFAIFDFRMEKILLCRDRLGVKPLYYYYDSNQFIFSSEIQAIISTSEDIDLSLDEQNLYDYFSLYYYISPQTPYKNIKSLNPGTTLSIDFSGTRLSQKRFWSMEFEENNNLDEGQWLNLLDMKFGKAVERQLQSDVPVGLFLSGGLDSTLLLSYLSEKFDSDLHTYTLGFQEKNYNEMNNSKIVSNIFGTIHHEKFMSPNDVIDNLSRFTKSYQMPLGDFTYVNYLLLSKMAAENSTVILTGVGGDELFGGYPTLIAHELYSQFNSLIPRNNKNIKRLISHFPEDKRPININFMLNSFYQAIRDNPLSTYLAFKQIFNEEQLKLLLNFNPDYNTLEFYTDKYTFTNGNSLLNLDTNIFLSNNTLPLVDFATSRFSLECRVPVMDNEMIDLSCKIPFEYKQKHLITKKLFRKLAKKRVNKKIAALPKSGFHVPWREWFRRELREFVLDIVNSQGPRNDTFINHSYVKKILVEHMSGRKDYSRKIMCILGYYLWRY